ncbi:MAG: hypothetical protein WCO71_09970, partial [Pseudomonadota bacterium]
MANKSDDKTPHKRVHKSPLHKLIRDLFENVGEKVKIVIGCELSEWSCHETKRWSIHKRTRMNT